MLAAATNRTNVLTFLLNKNIHFNTESFRNTRSDKCIKLLVLHILKLFQTNKNYIKDKDLILYSFNCGILDENIELIKEFINAGYIVTKYNLTYSAVMNRTKVLKFFISLKNKKYKINFDKLCKEVEYSNPNGKSIKYLKYLDNSFKQTIKNILMENTNLPEDVIKHTLKWTSFMID
jgi:hypothetical protein